MYSIIYTLILFLSIIFLYYNDMLSSHIKYLKSLIGMKNSHIKWRWNILYFIAYENDLQKYLEPDLNKLVKGKYTGDDVVYHFLIMKRGDPSPYRYIRVQGEIKERFWENGIPVKNDQPILVLKKFIRESLEKDRSENTAFFYNGHCDGENIIVTKKPCKDPTKTEETCETDPELVINSTNLAKTLEGMKIRFDIFSFDCCVMGNIQTLYTFRNVATIMICSPQYEGGIGLNSETLVEAFRNSKEKNKKLYNSLRRKLQSSGSRSDFLIPEIIALDYIRRTNIQSELEKGDTLDDKRDILVASPREVFKTILYVQNNGMKKA